MNTYWLGRHRGRMLLAQLQQQQVTGLCPLADISLAIGMLFAARVRRYLPVLQAALVDIGSKELAWLPTKSALTPGKMILVQIDRPPTENKGAKVRMNIQLSSPLLILRYLTPKIAISQQIDNEQARTLSAAVATALPQQTGAIVRTLAGQVPITLLQKSIAKLAKQLINAQNQCQLMTHPGPLTAQKWSGIVSETIHWCAHPTTYIIEDQDLSQQLQLYWQDVPIGLQPSFEKIAMSPSSAWLTNSIDRALQQAQDPVVTLANGGNLKFFNNGPFTFIDVNSGLFGSGRNRHFSVLDFNQQAVKAIAQLLPLRNIQGMIGVDLITMSHQKDQDQLKKTVTDFFSKDPLQVKVEGLSGASLLHLTRERLGLPVSEHMEL